MYNKYALGSNGTYHIFELIESFNINGTSQVSEFPLVNKSKIIDHKFNEPRTVSLSGRVSNYNKNNYYNIYETDTKTFKQFTSNIQNKLVTKSYEFFENLKEENVIFTIYTPSLQIDSCILTDINWNDNGEFAEYTLNFREIKTYFFNEITIQQVQPDPNLPDLNDAIPQSAVETLLLKDSTETDLYIYNALLEKDLIDPNFGARVGRIVGYAALIGVGIGLALATGIVAVSSGGAVAGISALVIAATNPVGWIAIAIAVVALVVIVLIFALVNWIRQLEKQRLYIDEFRVYKNDSDMIKEAKRYSGMVKDIYAEIAKLNQFINAYKMNSNVKQELLITLGDENFIIVFENISGIWHYKITDSSGNIVKENSILVVFNSFYKCKNDNYEFSYNNERLYFVYDLKAVADSFKEIQYSNPQEVSSYVITNVDLTKVNIVTTSYNLNELSNIIAKITIERMRRK